MIINHADVQRMLLTQKAIAEGALSLAMECNRLYDLVHAGPAEEKQENWLLLEILTPIVKTYSSEQGSRSAALAIQVLGGYGYTTDFPVQQHYRDLKIMSLYEGTTGIQSIDLLGRKVPMEKGKALQILIKNINDTVTKAGTYQPLGPYSLTLWEEVGRVQSVVSHISRFAADSDVDRYLSDAAIFMEQLSYVVIGWQWLKQATIAYTQIQSGDFSEQMAEFYEGKIHTMKFFFRYELTHAEACAKTMMHPEYLTNVKKQQILI
jgi:hypothetical protein